MELVLSGTELEEGEPITELIECATEFGVAFVELWYPRNTVGEGIDRVVSRLADAGLQVACVSTGSELYRHGGSVADQDLLLEAIELAGRMQARYVNTYFGYASERDDETAIATYRKYLQPCLDVAVRHGVTIVLENEFNAFGVDAVASDITRRPVALQRLLQDVNHPHFRSNFDPCNFYCAGVEPFPHAYGMLAPFIGYIHVKDCSLYDPNLETWFDIEGWQLYSDFDRRFITRPLGQGIVPWSSLITQLQADGYSGFLSLEPHAEQALLRQAWGQAVDYIRKLQAFAHEWIRSDKSISISRS